MMIMGETLYKNCNSKGKEEEKGLKQRETDDDSIS